MSKELYHHGIQGQKWGIRNGPPYPLDSSKSTGSKLKSEIVSNIENNTNSFIKSYKSKKYSGSLNKKSIDIKSTYMGSIFSFFNIFKDSLKLNEEKEMELNIKNSKENGEFEKINGKHSYIQDAENVNPNYNSGVEKWENNCALCAITYDMRRRGFDVTANPSENGRTIEKIADFYNAKVSDFNHFLNSNDFKKKIESEPNGSRGFINCNSGITGEYHVLSYEKTKNDTLIIDSQSNELYTMDEAFKNLTINEEETKDYFYFRTDDKNPNMDLIYDACTNRKR